ncbi:PREDICTED: uncharacterized protein LOC105976303 [Erythranthe guttata]|uniref:uncharacterized protein LOC105976303 n=1 Tax=Erythranthe guttata TaxID=4155 RepID=UPI00064DDD2E|nr:PREDICTED: uncharacterized protein LOC105976303 [Erythranthe guttata]|eukprot:XP_012857031.1 PREDICTED: uncharacterized protein LOC105976303 [Erythranthe guttata]
MAEGTRAKDQLETQKKLVEQRIQEEMGKRQAVEMNLQEQIHQNQLRAEKSFENLQIQLAKIAERMEVYHRDKSIMGEGSSAGNGSFPPHIQHENMNRTFQESRSNRNNDQIGHSDPFAGNFNPNPRLEFPRFDGTNPRSWLFKCQGYFQLVTNLTEKQKVTLAGLNFEGRAAVWFSHLLQQGSDYTWDQFVGLVAARFEELKEAKVLSELMKLKVTTSLEDYISRFEELKSYLMMFNTRVYDEEFFMTCFESGLPEDNQQFSSLFEAKNLQQAFDQTRKQEALLEAIAKRGKLHSKPMTSQAFQPKRLLQHNHQNTQTALVKANPTQANHPPRKNLTLSEMRARREKGLCFNCDEQYQPGHKCKYTQLYMVMTSAEEEAHLLAMSSMEQVENEEQMENVEVSLNAIAGQSGARTIKVQGELEKGAIKILIDTGSTHSFICEQLAQQLNCVTTEAKPMLVTVANGGKMMSRQVVEGLKWWIQGEPFSFPLRLLKLGGYHIILGCDWLWENSPVKFDYKRRFIKIRRGEQKLLITAEEEGNESQLLSLTPMEKIGPYTPSLQLSVPTEIAELLKQFEELFLEPQGLPPIRGTEHQIILKPDAVPKQLCPYRYSHSSKNEIESIVEELLRNGTIRNSQSPFASPVLLVKKKDLTWRMCVDYMYLNTMTVKHDYPIPVIDELLDELNGPKWFTKMNG